MLTVEYNPKGEVSIAFDQEGLETLMWNLNQLKKENHVHLFGPSFGGYELSEEEPDEGSVSISKLTLRKVKDLAPTQSD